MAVQFSVQVRNARLDAFETSIGASAVMEILTGAPPANCASASTGSVLATITLPADWMNDASGGSKTKAGTWQDASADDTGVAGYFRIYEAGSPSVCHMQGTVTQTGESPTGDMEVDNVNFAAGQSFTVTTFTLTDGNA